MTTMDSNVISILQLVNVSLWVLYDNRLASFVVIENKETIRMKMEVRDCEIYSRSSPTLNRRKGENTKGAFGNHDNGHYLEINGHYLLMAIIDNGRVFGWFLMAIYNGQ